MRRYLLLSLGVCLPIAACTSNSPDATTGGAGGAGGSSVGGATVFDGGAAGAHVSDSAGSVSGGAVSVGGGGANSSFVGATEAGAGGSSVGGATVFDGGAAGAQVSGSAGSVSGGAVSVVGGSANSSVAGATNTGGTAGGASATNGGGGGVAGAANHAGNGGMSAGILQLQWGAEQAVTRLTQLLNGPADEVYVVGSTNGDLGNITRLGAMDGFASKFDRDGNHQWTQHIGDLGIAPGIATKIWDAALTPDADVVVAGLVNGRGNFRGHVLTATFTGFVALISRHGDERWLRLIGGQDGATEAMGIEVSPEGAIAVAGVTSATILDGEPTLGASDVFLTTFTAAGDRIWTRRFGGPKEEYPSAFSGKGSNYYFASASVPQNSGELTEVGITRVDGSGTMLGHLDMTSAANAKITAMHAIDEGVCVALAYPTYFSEWGAGVDYGFDCFDEELSDLSGMRRGVPGSQALPTAIDCLDAARCDLAGFASVSFEGEPIVADAEGFVVTSHISSPLVGAVRFAPKVATDSYVRITAIVRRSDGTLIAGGESNAEMFSPMQGVVDGFVTTVGNAW